MNKLAIFLVLTLLSSSTLCAFKKWQRKKKTTTAVKKAAYVPSPTSKNTIDWTDGGGKKVFCD